MLAAGECQHPTIESLQGLSGQPIVHAPSDMFGESMYRFHCLSFSEFVGAPRGLLL